MPFIYIPALIYAAMLETMFKNWGHREQRVTIIAQETSPLLALPAPQQQTGGM